jgi:hypothetical protein
MYKWWTANYLQKQQEDLPEFIGFWEMIGNLRASLFIFERMEQVSMPVHTFRNRRVLPEPRQRHSMSMQQTKFIWR